MAAIHDPGGRLGQMLRNARRRRETRRAAQHLLAMDDHLLRDINLTRADAVAMLRRSGR